jgi:hypothetical protein
MSAQDWINLGTQLIAKNGRATAATVTRAQPGTYSTTLLETSGDGTALTFSILCAPVDYAADSTNALMQQPTYNSTLSYKKLYVPGGTSYVPAIGDVVTLDKAWTVTKILNEFETNSVKCAYLLQITS